MSAVQVHAEEALLHTAVHTGVPATDSALAVAQRVLAELEHASRT